MLRVRRESHTGTVSDYMIFKETIASLITSSFVVTEAHRTLPPETAGKFTPQQLADLLRVKSDETELLTVSMKIRSPLTVDESIVVLDSVVGAFQSEVIENARNEQVATLSRLRNRYAREYETHKKKMEEASKLAKATGTADSANMLESQGSKIAILQTKLLELQLQQIKVTESHESDTDNQAVGDDGEPLQAVGSRDTALQAQIDFTEKELAEATEKLLESGQISGELDVRMAELTSSRSQLAKIRAEMSELEFQIEQPPSVIILQKAVRVE